MERLITFHCGKSSVEQKYKVNVIMLITFEIINWSPIRKLEEDVQAMEAF
jgi:hypothetical protein